MDPRIDQEVVGHEEGWQVWPLSLWRKQGRVTKVLFLIPPRPPYKTASAGLDR